MTTPSDHTPVKVHIVKNDTTTVAPKATRVRSAPMQHVFDGSATGIQSRPALNFAPTRKRATFTVIGDSSVVIYICTAHSDAQKLSGCPVQGGTVVVLKGSDELHLGAAQGMIATVGIIAEYEITE